MRMLRLLSLKFLFVVSFAVSAVNATADTASLRIDYLETGTPDGMGENHGPFTDYVN